MNGNLNNPKAVPSPGSKTLDQAIGLLSAFGNKDTNLKTLLEEMKEVQVHNEAIKEEFKKLVNSNSRILTVTLEAQKDLTNKAREFKNYREKAEKEIQENRESLLTEKQNMQTVQMSREKEHAGKKSWVEDKLEQASIMSAENLNLAAELKDREEQVSTGLVRNKELKAALIKTFSDIRNIIPSKIEIE